MLHRLQRLQQAAEADNSLLAIFLLVTAPSPYDATPLFSSLSCCQLNSYRTNIAHSQRSIHGEEFILYSKSYLAAGVSLESLVAPGLRVPLEGVDVLLLEVVQHLGVLLSRLRSRVELEERMSKVREKASSPLSFLPLFKSINEEGRVGEKTLGRSSVAALSSTLTPMSLRNLFWEEAARPV